jgi:hypothetical protein
VAKASDDMLSVSNANVRVIGKLSTGMAQELGMQLTPHPPAGRSRLAALSIHNPSPCGPKPPSGDGSAGEGPARVPMKLIGVAVHPLPSAEKL